jgi:hypothetical protein
MRSASGTTSTAATVGAIDSTEPPTGRPSLIAAIRSLGPGATLAAAGALAIPISLLLPWYGITFTSLSQTGLGAFGFAHLALVLTAGAALVLIARCARGYQLPRPLDEGVLLALAGAWASLLVGYLMLDRPDELASSPRIGLRLGIFLALGGSIALLLGGLRLRRERPAR